MNKYQHLTPEQRHRLFYLLKQGYNHSQIARTIAVHRSTISRELKLNPTDSLYFPRLAHRMTLKRRRRSPWKIENNPLLQENLKETLQHQQ